MPISSYSTTRDSNASIAPGDLRSNDYRRDQQIINAIRQLMADLALFVSSTGDPTFNDTILVNFGGVRVVTIGGDSNGSIELGKVDGSTSTPFIDFHSGATVVDHDVRIIASGGTGVSGGAQLEIIATPLYISKGQLKFPASQNASADANTLDDYEEGTWTPVLTFSTSGDLNVAYSTQVGRYQKVGNRVHLMFTIVTSTFTHTTAAGECRITGVPFTSVNVGGPIWSGAMSWGNAITPPGGRTQVNIELAANSSTLRPIASGPGVSRGILQPADMPTGTQVVLVGNITYEAAA